MAQKATLLEWLWNLVFSNFGTKVVSVIIAVVLWGIVLGSRSVEVVKEVPLEVITSPDLVPSNEIPDKVAFRLAGPKAFVRTILDRRDDPIQVNLSNSKPTVVTYRFFPDSIRVPIGVKILSINPTSILVKLERLKRRDVPVKVDLHGVPPEGFRVLSVEVHPKVVKIRGAESRVDGVTEIPSTPIDLSRLKSNVDRELSLDLSHSNVQLEGALPRLFIKVEPIAEATKKPFLGK